MRANWPCDVFGTPPSATVTGVYPVSLSIAAAPLRADHGRSAWCIYVREANVGCRRKSSVTGGGELLLVLNAPVQNLWISSVLTLRPGCAG
jgi:hypothetical protein